MWDENGFETLKDCTSWERQSLMNTIAGKELTPAPVNLFAMTMRARTNPQRAYEIYTFNTDENINEETLWEIAQENPQALVDMIRKNGKKLYANAKYTEARIK